MDVDVPTPGISDEVAKLVDCLSLPEHTFWKNVVANGGTDIEQFKAEMAKRKKELD